MATQEPRHIGTHHLGSTSQAPPRNRGKAIDAELFSI
eukprot:SAG31_NODE_36591_length_312_cov_0.676056_1_plen_36_part_10